MKELLLVLKFIPLGFSALLPIINPIGSAVLFLSVVGNADLPTMKSLARRIAISTIWFLLIVQVAGGYILRFFGISLPIVQVAGGLVLAIMGWGWLNQQEPERKPATPITASSEGLQDKIFYPLTFPITARPRNNRRGADPGRTRLHAIAARFGARPPRLALCDAPDRYRHLFQLRLCRSHDGQTFSLNHSRHSACHVLYIAVHRR